ncbi:MAG: DUF559 domain-containing protein, partial [Brachybacterium sp.]|nr:DUF559 domain-containing protein [Brachybacterium sp.]
SHPLVNLQEIAPRLDHAALVVCADAIVGRWCPDIRYTLEDLRRDVARLTGKGAARVRAAARDAVADSWSPMETRVRLLLISQGFPVPVCNSRIVDPDTGQWFYLDLAYPTWRIAIEYDSEDHRLDRGRWQRDLHKNHVLHSQGWVVLRISIADIINPARFLTRLKAAISRAERPE